MKKYIAPEIELDLIAMEDILTLSNGGALDNFDSVDEIIYGNGKV